jgi:hypothetical protein
LMPPSSNSELVFSGLITSPLLEMPDPSGLVKVSI